MDNTRKASIVSRLLITSGIIPPSTNTRMVVALVEAMLDAIDVVEDNSGT